LCFCQRMKFDHKTGRSIRALYMDGRDADVAMLRHIFWDRESESGNDYTVQRFGNTTMMNGYNAQTGNSWSQNSQTFGGFTHPMVRLRMVKAGIRPSVDDRPIFPIDI